MTKKNVVDHMTNDSTRVNVYVKNGRVRRAMKESENQSEFFEIAALYYLDSVEKVYVTKEEVKEMLQDYDRNVCILNQNYIQMISVLEDISKELFKHGGEQL